MKIVHTSDWHLGQNFYRYDRDDEHRHFFSQLASLLAREHPDALVVSGDIYHTSAPSASAQRLMVEGVMKLHDASPDTIIVISAGNHDSGSRLEADRELWLRLGVHVIGSCCREADGTFDPGQFLVDVKGRGYVLAIPYFHPSNYPLAHTEAKRDERQRLFYDAVLSHIPSDGLPVVMMAHLAVSGCNMQGHESMPIGGMDTEDISELGCGYDYLALGHIHKPQSLSERAFYSGSPMPMSFSEQYEHYVNIVDIAARGDLPLVCQHEILPLIGVVTLPPDGAPLPQALDALNALDAADTSYVRLLIDQDGLIDVDAEERARAIVQDKACRFCEVHRKPRTSALDTSDRWDYNDIDQLLTEDPIQLACHSYSRKFNADMEPELLDLLTQAINEVKATDL